MLIHLIKFIHVLFALGLLGTTIYCLTFFITTSPRHALVSLNKFLLLLSLFAMLTGTLLVHPKNFTFQTPWIQAAYFLLFVYAVGISLFLILKKINRWVGLFFYLILFTILILITHDAVTKTTLF